MTCITAAVNNEASGQAETSSSRRQEEDWGRGINIYRRRGRKCQWDDTHTHVCLCAVAGVWWMTGAEGGSCPTVKQLSVSEMLWGDWIDRLCATLQFFPRAPHYRRSVRTLIKDLTLRPWQTHSLCSELKVCTCVFRAKDLVANTFLSRASHTVLKQRCLPKVKMWTAGTGDASLHCSVEVSIKKLI